MIFKMINIDGTFPDKFFKHVGQMLKVCSIFTLQKLENILKRIFRVASHFLHEFVRVIFRMLVHANEWRQGRAAHGDGGGEQAFSKRRVKVTSAN